MAKRLNWDKVRREKKGANLPPKRDYTEEDLLEIRKWKATMLKKGVSKKCLNSVIPFDCPV